MIRIAAAAATMALIACGGARDLPAASTDGGTITADGLPCDVAKVFADRCIGCHSHPPITGVPNALVTYDDLAKADPYDSSKTSAQGSLARMKAGTMPPGGGLTAAELATVESWVNAGAAKGICDTTPTDGGTTGGTDGGTTVSGLPCDVSQLLAAKCVTCHSAPPRAGAPQALASYEDMIAKDPYDATKTNAQGSLARMAAGTMPPGGSTAGEIAVMQAWVNAGTPKGLCDGSVPQPDALPDLGTACSIGQGTTARGPTMRPGQACIACHQSDGEAPVYPIMGTVYPSVHEADLCKGIAGITIEITDKNGVVHTGTANSAGNFMIGGSIPKPYTAKVKSNGKERAMIGPQTSGDCNSCHTGAGTQGAPGRVVAP